MIREDVIDAYVSGKDVLDVGTGVDKASVERVGIRAFASVDDSGFGGCPFKEAVGKGREHAIVARGQTLELLIRAEALSVAIISRRFL